ncbi:hypothetical protein [Paraflavitalea sp. CAU 1676]|uniref:hypothetical protein n=1 Tax=Paraflavitalea sp. CAU 1676 TaxID=3032598 RepID=UPI0023DA6519|nr:hypothetical protein [Paraflavitalea sp. CAU 1676]MDF2190362.1 hypothetical protein [Paraflavitalea sp. CAU 1676]
MKNTLTVSIMSSDPEDIRQLRQTAGKSTSEVQVEEASIETQPGVAETISVLSLVISFASGIGSQLVASWIYDRFKSKKEKPAIEIYINGAKVSTEAEIKAAIEKESNPATP